MKIKLKPLSNPAKLNNKTNWFRYVHIIMKQQLNTYEYPHRSVCSKTKYC